MINDLVSVCYLRCTASVFIQSLLRLCVFSACQLGPEYYYTSLSLQSVPEESTV